MFASLSNLASPWHAKVAADYFGRLDLIREIQVRAGWDVNYGLHDYDPYRLMKLAEKYGVNADRLKAAVAEQMLNERRMT
jgi:hypothetical protein